MNSVDGNDEWVEPEKKTLLQKLMRPLEYIGFSLGCLIFCVIYWCVFIPAFYFGMYSKCTSYHSCPYPGYWRYFFWMLTSGVWVIIISAAICYYSCEYGREDSDDELEEEGDVEKKEPNENDKFFSGERKHSNLDTEVKEFSTTEKST